jgi:RecB family endonuclease NucS
MKLITVAITAVLAVGTAQAFEPVKWQENGMQIADATPVKKGKLMLAKKKDHSKDEAKPAKKSKSKK